MAKLVPIYLPKSEVVRLCQVNANSGEAVIFVPASCEVVGKFVVNINNYSSLEPDTLRKATQIILHPTLTEQDLERYNLLINIAANNLARQGRSSINLVATPDVHACRKATHIHGILRQSNPDNPSEELI